MTNTGSRKQSKSKLLPYQNPKLSLEKRTKDLLSRMTLEEKAAQMVCIWRDRPKAMLDDDGNFDENKANAFFKKGNGIGQVTRPSDAGKGKNARETAELTNKIQKFFLENSRLKSPPSSIRKTSPRRVYRAPTRRTARTSSRPRSSSQPTSA